VSGVLIEGHGVTRHFPVRRGLFRRGAVRAVSGVDLGVRRGETVGLVGESGSGKSTLGRLMLGLLPLSAGQVTFDGIDVATRDRGQLRILRRRMQLVFQDPYASLDPRRPAGDQIADGLAIHAIGTPQQRRARVRMLLDQVGLAPEHAARLPGSFSGGQRQRIAIARALATEPDFIVADEPVSALDVSVQAQILRLLAGLKDRLGLAMLFISHDLAVVRHLSDRVVVLYLGKVMEEGPAQTIFAEPRHPYTLALLSATPELRREHRRARQILGGEPPSPAAPPSGCVFRTRCPVALPACADAVPTVTVSPGHRVSCLRAIS
jgi:peptide/nickel transport system ATP-binding protein